MSSGGLRAWVKIRKIDNTCGFFREIDQRGIFIESEGRLLEPQVSGFIQKEAKNKEDEIFTASINMECTKASPIFDIPSELEGKCTGTCKLSRKVRKSLRGREAEAFSVQMNLKINELTVATILALKTEWIFIEPIFYPSSPSPRLSELQLGESRELFIERFHIGTEYEI
jgi:hypothetical protein